MIFDLGEAWQDVMMSCIHDPEKVGCFHKPFVAEISVDGATASGAQLEVDSCGSDFAYPYFVTFYVLCSFLVRCFGLIDFDNFCQGINRIDEKPPQTKPQHNEF